MRFTFASSVFARAINVRRFFHCFALRAAVFARRRLARTDGMCAFHGFCDIHLFFTWVWTKALNPVQDDSGPGKQWLYRKEHNATFDAYPGS